MIFINDGSTDNTKEILDSYKDKLHATHLDKNKGIHYARLTGIEQATALYICFIHADDYVDDSYYVELLKIISNNDYDIVQSLSIESNCYKNLDNDAFRYYKETLGENIINKEYLYGSVGCSHTIWNKIFRRDIIKRCLEAYNNGLVCYYKQDGRS